MPVRDAAQLRTGSRSLTHPEDAAHWKGTIAKALKSKDWFRCDRRAVRRDGEVIWIHHEEEVRRDADGGPLAVIGTAQDVTEIRRTVGALERKNYEFGLVFDSVPESPGSGTDRKNLEDELARHCIHVRDDQSAAISRELHDEPGPALTALAMDLRLVAHDLWGQREAPGTLAADDTLCDMRGLLNEAVSKVRNISQGLASAKPGRNPGLVSASWAWKSACPSAAAAW